MSVISAGPTKIIAAVAILEMVLRGGLSAQTIAVTPSPGPTQAVTAKTEFANLLDEVKRREVERQKSAKQRELGRANEDGVKARKEADQLQQDIEATISLVDDTGDYLGQLVAQEVKLTNVLELNKLRSDAEKLKIEGLTELNKAQLKSLDTLQKYIEEVSSRINLVTSQVNALETSAPEADATPSEKAAYSKLSADMLELTKKQTAAKAAWVASDKVSTDANKAASVKLEAADVAAVKARRKALDLGLAEEVASEAPQNKPSPSVGPQNPPIKQP